jgi:hypothetical protein
MTGSHFNFSKKIFLSIISGRILKKSFWKYFGYGHENGHEDTSKF